MLVTNGDLAQELAIPNVFAKDGGGTSFEQLLIRGSLDEDEPASRGFNHFYDPVYGSGFHPCWAIAWGGTCVPSPDWALEDRVDVPPQEFSLRDAREHLYLAETSQNQSDRVREWTLTFLTLGHVIHHLQDMGQPQHTRNDGHPPYLGGVRSFWEEYSDDRIIDQGAAALQLSGYPTISIGAGFKPRDLWYTGATGRGLAEFSNRNYVTAGTNFTMESGTLVTPVGYASPSASTAALNVMTIEQLRELGENIPASTPDGVITLIASPLHDAANDGVAIPESDWISAYSIYSEDLLRQSTLGPAFAVNKVNIEHALAVLLPRAAAYGASLLNYFFRVRLGFEAVIGETDTWRITNKSTAAFAGLCRVYYDDALGQRQAVSEASWQVTLAAGGATGVTFSPSEVPADSFILICNGPADAGDATALNVTAVKAVHREHGFVTPGGRMAYDGSNWTVEKGKFAYGNVNWYGTGGVLSWIGPWGRYSNPRGVSELSRIIYENGEAKYEAPGPVIGAAMQNVVSEGHSEGYLVAITVSVGDGGLATQENAYRAAISDLEENPSAWGDPVATYVLADAGGTDGMPAANVAPANYFFNSSGTEAQSVKAPGQTQQLGTYPSVIQPYRRMVYRVDGGFYLEPTETNAPYRDDYSAGDGGDGCCAYLATTPGNPLFCSSSGSHTEERVGSSTWTIAADYIGDTPVYALKTFSFTQESSGHLGYSSSSASSVDQIDETVSANGVNVVTQYVRESMAYSDTFTRGPCSGSCLYWEQGACSAVLSGHSQSQDQLILTNGIEAMDLRQDPAMILLRRSTYEYHLDHPGDATNDEEPVWLIDGQEVSLAGARAADTERLQGVTATTDQDGHAILSWPDFYIWRLYPVGDPRSLTGFGGPSGLM